MPQVIISFPELALSPEAHCIFPSISGMHTLYVKFPLAALRNTHHPLQSYGQEGGIAFPCIGKQSWAVSSKSNKLWPPDSHLGPFFSPTTPAAPASQPWCPTGRATAPAGWLLPSRNLEQSYNTSRANPELFLFHLLLFIELMQNLVFATLFFSAES